jgi:hypothetical protein
MSGKKTTGPWNDKGGRERLGKIHLPFGGLSNLLATIAVKLRMFMS